jgi:hypothetical protein
MSLPPPSAALLWTLLLASARSWPLALALPGCGRAWLPRLVLLSVGSIALIPQFSPQAAVCVSLHAPSSSLAPAHLALWPLLVHELLIGGLLLLAAWIGVAALAHCARAADPAGWLGAAPPNAFPLRSDERAAFFSILGAAIFCLLDGPMLWLDLLSNSHRAVPICAMDIGLSGLGRQSLLLLGDRLLRLILVLTLPLWLLRAVVAGFCALLLRRVQGASSRLASGRVAPWFAMVWLAAFALCAPWALRVWASQLKPLSRLLPLWN